MKISRKDKDVTAYKACLCGFSEGKAAVPHYEVVAAILRYENKYLCMQRGASKFSYTAFKYEFPGGKVEAGESRPEALMRELREEMDLAVTVREEDFLMTVEHEYPDFSITLHCFVVPVASPEFVLKEHASFVWLPKEELASLDWAAADAGIIAKLAE